jgi:hypothetical protein
MDTGSSGLGLENLWSGGLISWELRSRVIDNPPEKKVGLGGTRASARATRPRDPSGPIDLIGSQRLARNARTSKFAARLNFEVPRHHNSQLPQPEEGETTHIADTWKMTHPLRNKRNAEQSNSWAVRPATPPPRRSPSRSRERVVRKTMWCYLSEETWGRERGIGVCWTVRHFRGASVIWFQGCCQMDSWKNGIFSTSSLYNELTFSGFHNRWLLCMWKTKIPLKIRIFLWQVINDKIQSAEQLKIRN